MVPSRLSQILPDTAERASKKYGDVYGAMSIVATRRRPKFHRNLSLLYEWRADCAIAGAHLQKYRDCLQRESDSDIDGAIQNDEELTFSMTKLLPATVADPKFTGPNNETIFSIAEEYGVGGKFRAMLGEWIK